MKPVFQNCPRCLGLAPAFGRFCAFCGQELSGPEGTHVPTVLLDRLDPPPDLFGRQVFLDALLPFAQEAANGRGQTWVWEGEPGVGKRSAARALASHLSLNGFLVIGLTGDPTQTPLTGAPIREAISSLLGLRPTDPPGTIQKRLSKLTQTGLDAIDLRDLTVLFPLPDPPKNAETTDASIRLGNLWGALVKLVHRLARQRPILFVCDRLSAFDPMTLKVLETLSRFAQDDRVILLILRRPSETLPSLHPQTRFLRLERLAMKDILSSLRHQVGVNRLPPEVEERITEAVEGWPLRLNLLIGYLRERGFFLPTPKGVKVNDKMLHLPFPQSEKDLLDSRLDLLKPHHLDLLRLTAVLGVSARRSMLETLYPHPQFFRQDLDELSQREFLRTLEPGEDPRYGFTHPFIEESIRAQLSTSALSALNTKAASALHKAGAEHGTLASWLAALHSTHHLVPRDGLIHYLERQGDQFLKRLHPGAAVLCFQRASQLLRAAAQSDPSSSRSREIKLSAILGKLARAYILWGEPGRIEKAVRVALELDQILKFPILAAELNLAHAAELSRRGMNDQARRRLDEALAHARTSAQPLTEARVLIRMAEWALRQGLLDETGTLLDRIEDTLAPAPGLGDSILLAELTARTHLARGLLLAERSRPEAARTELEKALDLAGSIDHAETMLGAEERLGLLDLSAQNAERALEHLTRAETLARKEGHRWALCGLLIHKGRACALRGDRDGARQSYYLAGIQARELTWPEGEDRARDGMTDLA